jgi:hypothetical protein
VEGLEEPLVFHQNENSNQWWIEVQSIQNEMVFLACNEEDYKCATRNEIPELWLKYIQKTDELLK